MNAPAHPLCGFPHAHGQRCAQPARGIFLVHVTPPGTLDARTEQLMVLAVCSPLYELLGGAQ